MRLFKNILILTASALVGLALYGCNQPVQTTGTPTTAATSSNDVSAVATNSTPSPMNDVPAVVTNSGSALTNEPPATVTNSPVLPESAVPVSTNDLPPAAPLATTP